MKSEVIKFYADKSLQIQKMIARAPEGLKKEQIEAAAVEVYNDIKNGLEIKTLSIVRRVWEAAKYVDAHQYVKDNRLIKESKNIIAEKDVKYKKLLIGFITFFILVAVEMALRWL